MTGRRAAGTALAGAAGVAMALQARLNGELGDRLQDGIAAATISFGIGLALLAVAAAASVPGRAGLRAVRAGLRSGALRWWHCLGGVCGGFVVASQALTVAALGVAVFTVALVAGLSASSLVVDRSGLPPGAVEPVTPTRLLGAVLCLVAVVVAVADRLAAPESLGAAALPLLAGAGIAYQQAVTGRVRAVGGSALPAAVVNFLAGAAALSIAAAVMLAVRGWPTGELPAEPWLYAGGVLGVLVIATVATVVRATGVLLLGMSAIAGQVIGALALDLAVPTDGLPGGNTYAGAALTLAAVAVAVSGRRARQHAPAD